MTADVNVDVNVLTSEMEVKCELDMSSYEDLPTAAADCNGVKGGNENAKGNGEDDPDTSYVFVVGNEAVADQPTDTPDLNGKSEPIENVGSRDNDIEDEVTESDVDPGIGNSIEALLNHEVTSNDGGKERENGGVVPVSNGTVPIVAPEAHGLEGQGEVEDDHVKLDSLKDIEGSREFQVNVSVDVEPEIQVNFSVAKAGEEDIAEPIVTQESQVTTRTDQGEVEEDSVKLDSPKDVEGSREFQVNVSVDIEPEIQVNFSVANAGEEDIAEPIVTQESQVTTRTDQGEVEDDHVKLDSPKDVEGSREFQVNVSVDVEPEIQVNFSVAKAGEEDIAEPIVTQESQVTTRTDQGEVEEDSVKLDSPKDVEGSREFQVNVSVDIEPEIQVNFSVANAGEEDIAEPIVTQESQVTTRTDQGEVEEDSVKLDSPKDVEGSREFQVNVSVDVEPEIQVNSSVAKAGEEDSAEPIVTQESQVATRTDQGEVEEDIVKLDSPKDVEGSREFQVNVSVDAEPEIQVNSTVAKAGEEDSAESIVIQESQVTTRTDKGEVEEDSVKLDSPKHIEGSQEFQVNVSLDVEPEIQVNVSDAKAGEEDSAESIVTQESQVTTTTDQGEVEENHIKLDSLKDLEETREFQVNVSVAVEPEIQINVSNAKAGEEESAEPIVTRESQVTTRTDIVESEQNQFANIEVIAQDKIEGERKPNLGTNIKENQDSPILITEEFHIDDDLDLVRGEEPVGLTNNFPVDSAQKASEVQLEKIIETTPCLVVPDIEDETLISTDAEIGRNETITFDAENGKSFLASIDNDAIGYPTNEIAVPVVQLESDDVNGHITFEKGENLPTLHAEESISQTSVNLVQTTPEENKHSEVISSFSVAPDSASKQAVKNGGEIGDSCPVDDISVVEKLDVNSLETIDSRPVSDKKEVIETESCPLVTDTKPTCIANDVVQVIEMDSMAFESQEKVSTFSCDEVDIESEVSSQAIRCVDINPVSIDDPVPVDVGSESSTLPSKETSNDDGHAFESEVLDGCEKTLNCIQDDLEKTGQELDLGDEVNEEETSTISPEASIDASDGQNTVNEVGKRPFYYIIRIPRYDDDENLKEQIKHAQFQVDEKTKSRDVIRAEMQRKRADCNECGDCLDAAKSEEVAARDLLKAKRKEIDSVLSVINRVKSAFSVEDIDGKIRNMKHMIEHETLPLKEEKNYIREIKQLKQIREQLSSSLGNQEDVREAIDQKEQVEERLKLLRKEADLLRENVLKAETATKIAKKKCQDENAKLNELIAQFRAADNIRQKEYAHLQSLRKRLYDKNKYFWNYKDDAKAAYDLASKGEKEELQRHCVNQVERVMELWNSNDEFRKEYTRCNMRSTLRRLRTLDGRLLGPDEDPPVIPVVVTERVAKGNIISSISTVEKEKTEAPVEAEKTIEKSTAKFGDQNNPTVKFKKPAKHATMGNGLAATVSGRNEIEKTVVSGKNEIEKTVVSGRNEIENIGREEVKQTKEEEELARKAEELRKEEEAAMWKEQRRLEEKAKAKEAMERKKKNADKAQARAVLRALKEAEQKEKEREKKARKKEKRKALAEDVNSVNDGESDPISEIPTETTESEAREKPMEVTKRPQKPSHFTKQTKSKSVPLPLRNRSKRRIQTWMWVLLSALAVFALFLMGNGSFFLQRFGF